MKLVGFYDDLVPYQMPRTLKGNFSNHLLVQLIILLSHISAFFFSLFSTLFLFKSFLFYFFNLFPQFNELGILQAYLGHCFGKGDGVYAFSCTCGLNFLLYIHASKLTFLSYQSSF